jgi:arylsulfatase A
MPGLEEAPEGEYLTDRLAAEAEKFIAANKEKPFFLYLPHYTVHIPLKARQELIDKYEAAPTPPGRQNNPIYAAMIESMDEAVGRVLAALESAGIADRTVVVFTSDNGGLVTAEGPNTPATSNAPLREGKGWLYDGGIRVPLIIKWPGRTRAGGASTFPVCSIDLFPTLLEICGVAGDARPDGLSLVPLLKQSAKTLPRDALYWHYPHYANQGGKPGGVIRVGDFKLIEFYETGRRELFNIRRDPGESQNIADQARNKVDELATRLADWRRDVGAQMPELNPDYVPNPQAGDGTITLPAKTADVHGAMLRYEPIPQKNTLGYWTRVDDWASWEFQVNKPGTFRVEILVGCGTGSGGSMVDFTVDDQIPLRFSVKETGGFQNFVTAELGTITLKDAGRHTLTVKPQSKPGQAVMDLREVKLVPGA